MPFKPLLKITLCVLLIYVSNYIDNINPEIDKAILHIELSHVKSPENKFLDSISKLPNYESLKQSDIAQIQSLKAKKIPSWYKYLSFGLILLAGMLVGSVIKDFKKRK